MLALLFPGQASQEVGMGRDVFEASASARAVFEAADAVLSDALEVPLSKLCFEGPEAELRRTEIQQPAILTTSIALLRALEEQVGPIEPGYVGGHSLGEYTALVAAGALGFEDAVRTVNMRGRLMQEAVAEGRGAMAAVLGVAPEVVADACAHAAGEAGLVVAPANFNSSQQTVIAGDVAAVEAACARARALGAKKTVPLPVSAPFHCALMEPAAEKLSVELDRLEWNEATPPVITNVEAEPNADANRIASLLREQVTAPVRFTDMIARMKVLGVDRFLEVGPGRVLSGLIARIERRARRANFSSLGELEDVRRFVSDFEVSV
ncbi:MAG: [acyl-carrier-protein] S-malonyltransferase [Deltaproteobacteria bacterium]|nr:[acyl-carrier-protein] S-malonyltransferase [Deltaproteobacteria bacterium]